MYLLIHVNRIFSFLSVIKYPILLCGQHHKIILISNNLEYQHLNLLKMALKDYYHNSHHNLLKLSILYNNLNNNVCVV